MFLRRSSSITPQDAAARVAAGEITLIDVREPGEVRSGRIRGAKNIPLGELRGRLGEIDRARPVAFVCLSGARSGVATRAAKKAGLDAVNVRGGAMAWSRAGLR